MSAERESERAEVNITSSIEVRTWGERSFYRSDLDQLCLVDSATLFLGHGAAWSRGA